MSCGLNGGINVWKEPQGSDEGLTQLLSLWGHSYHNTTHTTTHNHINTFICLFTHLLTLSAETL